MDGCCLWWKWVLSRSMVMGSRNGTLINGAFIEILVEGTHGDVLNAISNQIWIVSGQICAKEIWYCNGHIKCLLKCAYQVFENMIQWLLSSLWAWIILVEGDFWIEHSVKEGKHQPTPSSALGWKSILDLNPLVHCSYMDLVVAVVSEWNFTSLFYNSAISIFWNL